MSPIKRLFWNGSGWVGGPSSKPDASNTGTSGTLTLQSGDIFVTTPGSVIEDLDLTGKIVAQAANITVRNCRIRGGTLPGYKVNWGLVDANHSSCSGLIIEDCEMVPDTPNVGWNGVLGHDYTVRRSNIHRVVDGCGVYDTSSPNGDVDVTIDGNYIHDLSYIEPDPNHGDDRTHNDGIQIQGGAAIVIRGNNIVANVADGVPTDGPSPYYPSVTGQAIGITTGVGVTTDCLIEGNWIEYGANSITVAQQSVATTATIQNNRFGRNSHNGRPIVADLDLSMPGLPSTTGADTAGNVYDDDDTPVTVTRTDDY